jgi:hypothetical protein
MARKLNRLEKQFERSVRKYVRRTNWKSIFQYKRAAMTLSAADEAELKAENGSSPADL